MLPSRARSSLLALAAVLALPKSALAVRPEVEEAIGAFEELRYEQAERSLNDALALEGNSPEDLAAIYLHLGILAGAADREEEAEEQFRRAMEVDPLVELPPGQPPKITRPFGRARELWADARLRVDHTPPEALTAGEAAVLAFTVENDQMNMVVAARLYVSGGTDERERAYRQDGTGPFVFPVPPEVLVAGQEVRYRLEVLGRASSVLVRLGPSDELAVAVHRAPPRGTRVVRTPPPPPPRRPFYEQWWFWTTIGVVVAGAAAGTAIALTVPAEGVDFGAPEVVR